MEKSEADLECCAKELNTPGYSRRFLVHNTQHVLPLRNFYHEVRAMRDVDSLFYSIVVKLDVRHTHLEDILKE